MGNKPRFSQGPIFPVLWEGEVKEEKEDARLTLCWKKEQRSLSTALQTSGLQHGYLELEHLVQLIYCGWPSEAVARLYESIRDSISATSPQQRPASWEYRLPCNT